MFHFLCDKYPTQFTLKNKLLCGTSACHYVFVFWFFSGASFVQAGGFYPDLKEYSRNLERKLVSSQAGRVWAAWALWRLGFCTVSNFKVK